MAEQHWLDALGRGLAAGLSRKAFLRLAGSLALGALVGRPDLAEAARKKRCRGGKTRCGRKCVDLQTSRKHCGACRQPCRRGEDCSGGRCVGDGGVVTCGGEPCPDATFVCQDGACTCPEGREACSGSPQLRGGSPMQTCCPTGLTCCGGRCRSTQWDRQHCGGCDQPCTTVEVCLGGACRCRGDRVCRVSSSVEGVCCPEGTACCAISFPGTEQCCDRGEICCGLPHGGTRCCPQGTTDCCDGTCCTGEQQCCDRLCCEQHQSCCKPLGGPQRACCNPGERCCATTDGAAFCCPADQACGTEAGSCR